MKKNVSFFLFFVLSVSMIGCSFSEVTSINTPTVDITGEMTQVVATDSSDINEDFVVSEDGANSEESGSLSVNNNDEIEALSEESVDDVLGNNEESVDQNENRSDETDDSNLVVLDNSAEDAETELSSTQKNSLCMLNYLTVLSEEINESKGSRLYLEEAYSSLVNNTDPKAVDINTKAQLMSMLDTLESYRMVSVKRERLQYIYVTPLSA